jgi:glycosyltransferase involved in cell wall biosynthesis
MENPLISIVIPFYNASKYIIETLESVRNQTYNNWELILINDGSNDSSAKKVQEYLSDHPGIATVLSHPGGINKGASASRNLGLMQANGEFICFLDADDVWDLDFLDFFIHIFTRCPEISMAYGPFLFWHSWDEIKRRRKKDTVQKLGVSVNTIVNGRTLFKLFLANEGAVPSPSGVMFRRDALARVGGWENSFRGMYDDIALYSKLFLSGAAVYVADQCRYRYRQHDESLCGVARREDKYWASRKLFIDWLNQYIVQKKLGPSVSILVKQNYLVDLLRKGKYYIRRAMIGFYSSLSKN